MSLRSRLGALLLILLLIFGCAVPVAAEGMSDLPVASDNGGELTPDGENTSEGEEPEESWWQQLLGISNMLDVLQTSINQIEDRLNPTNAFTLIINLLNELITEFLNNALPWINETICSTFLSSTFISSMMGFFRWLAIILLTAGFIARLLRIVDASRHGEPANLGDFVLDLLKAYGLTIFCLPIINWLNQLFNNCTGAIVDVFSSDDQSGIIEALSASYGEIWGTSLLSFGLLIVTIIMLFRCMKRACTIFLQVILGYLYTYDLVKGSNLLTEWIKDVLAGFITFSFQIMFYNVGLQLMTDGLRNATSIFSAGTLVGITLLVGVSVIPATLRRFGQTPPPGSFSRGLGQAVNIGLGVARLAL